MTITPTAERISPDEFMRTTPKLPGGNELWAARYGMDLREIIVRQAHRQPRSTQRTLGPSELGAVCDRQVVGKFAGEQITNHVVDPWPSIVGTAVHAWLAEHFTKENTLNGVLRWVPEQRVYPDPRYPGTADLYDAATRTLVDWKALGETSLAKIKSKEGPPQHYRVQLLLYARGYRNLGLPVDRIILAALPRTGSSLSGMYCWGHLCGPEDDVVLSEVLRRTEIRRQVAVEVQSGRLDIRNVPITPGSDSCYFCPFFRPQSAQDNGPGCPGHSSPWDRE